MMHAKVGRGYVMATGGVSPDAIRFARTDPITSIPGRDLSTRIARMDDAQSARLLTLRTERGDTVPTCASGGGDRITSAFRIEPAARVCPRDPKRRRRIWTRARRNAP